MQVDPEFRSLIFPLSESEVLLLEESLAAEGCRDALVTWHGLLLDGHHRLSICQRRGIEYKEVEVELEDREAAKAWILKNQLARRNLTPFQRAELALKLEPLIAEKAKKRMLAGKADPGLNSVQGKTDEKVAKIAGISHDTIRKAKQIIEKASEEEKGQLRKGKTSIDQAFSQIKKSEREEEIERLAKIKSKYPVGLYQVIVIDPPWPHEGRYDPEGRRGPPPYPVMPFDELRSIKLPVADDCVLWLWAIHAFLRDAYSLLDAWGFSYKGVLVWDKEKMGLGHWLRWQCEFCLLAIKGKPFLNLGSHRDIIREPRREHSRKPEAFYQLVENMCPGTKIDYFARRHREGWAAYGNEVEGQSNET